MTISPPSCGPAPSSHSSIQLVPIRLRPGCFIPSAPGEVNPGVFSGGLVATCGGDTLCLIDCDSGMVMKKYKVAGEVCCVNACLDPDVASKNTDVSPIIQQKLAGV